MEGVYDKDKLAVGLGKNGRLGLAQTHPHPHQASSIT